MGAGAAQYQVERNTGSGATIIATLGNVSGFTDTTQPTGMPVYRVTGLGGENYLPPANLATSGPSNGDFANMNAGSYESSATMPIRAQHLIELRQAANQLAVGIGATPPYSASDLLVSSLQGSNVSASHFTTLMAKINDIRTNPALGMAAALFGQEPQAGYVIARAHLEDLRNALK
jgi:hypothetical protein